MASLSISNVTTSGCTWTISGSFSYPWNTTNYSSAGVTTADFKNGATSLSGTTSFVQPPNSLSNFISLSQGSYTLYAFAYWNGTPPYGTGAGFYHVDTKTVIIPPAPPAAPSNFSASSTAGTKIINVSWSASVGATTYSIAAKDTNGTWVLKGTTSSTSMSFSVDSFRTYQLRISATNSGGTSGYSTTSVDVEDVLPTYTIAITKGSYIDWVSGGGTYNSGATATVSAGLISTDYGFDVWGGTGVSPAPTSNPYSFTVTQSLTISANGKRITVLDTPDFTAASRNPALKQYTFEWNAITDAIGYEIQAVKTSSIFIEPGDVWFQAAAAVDTTATFTVSDYGNYYFKIRAIHGNIGLWSPYSSPIFYPIEKPTPIYSISLNMGTGVIGVTGGGNYEKGSTVLVSAALSSEYRFFNWSESGGAVSTSNPYIFSAQNSRILTANGTLALSRPSDWDGFGYTTNSTMTVTSDSIYVMSYGHWNDFTNRINEFRIYTAKPTIWFTQATPGMAFGYWIMNQAINAVNEMVDTPQALVSSGDPISVAIFQAIKDNINSI